MKNNTAKKSLYPKRIAYATEETQVEFNEVVRHCRIGELCRLHRNNFNDGTFFSGLPLKEAFKDKGVERRLYNLAIENYLKIIRNPKINKENADKHLENILLLLNATENEIDIVKSANIHASLKLMSMRYIDRMTSEGKKALKEFDNKIIEISDDKKLSDTRKQELILSLKKDKIDYKKNTAGVFEGARLDTASRGIFRKSLELMIASVLEDTQIITEYQSILTEKAWANKWKDACKVGMPEEIFKSFKKKGDLKGLKEEIKSIKLKLKKESENNKNE